MSSIDFLGILRVLRKHDVTYVLIGGVAASALGSPSVTQDIDICYERSDQNIERLVAALRALNAHLRGADSSLPFRLDAATIRMGDTFTFTTDHGDLDCLGTPAGTDGFRDLSANATTMDLDGFEVAVVSLDDLIRMKRAAGRPKDRVELEILGALREEVEGLE